MNKIIFVVVILLLIAGVAYYVFFSATPEKQVQPSAETNAVENVSIANDLPTLEQELQTTELGNLDKEFADIDTELNAALNKQ